jgi:hypothetical protein
MRNQTVELFCGTKSFSMVARQIGYRTWTCDLDPAHEPDVNADILSLRSNELPADVDVLWASPPCEAFSVAAIGKNWNRDYTPKHQRAVAAQELVRKTLTLIDATKPRWWFVENPRGMLRKLRWFDDAVRRMDGVRKTVTYCQYGDSRMKPTDIWTNADWWRPRNPCSSGASCHAAAPRGSKTGQPGHQGSEGQSAHPFRALRRDIPSVAAGHSHGCGVIDRQFARFRRVITPARRSPPAPADIIRAEFLLASRRLTFQASAASTRTCPFPVR